MLYAVLKRYIIASIQGVPKKAVFDVKDWTQKVISANGGYFEKVKEGYSDVMK